MTRSTCRSTVAEALPPGSVLPLPASSRLPPTVSSVPPSSGQAMRPSSSRVRSRRVAASRAPSGGSLESCGKSTPMSWSVSAATSRLTGNP